jgi:hypothetical protein
MIKHQCKIAACNKVISSLNSEKRKCKKAKNPKTCMKKIESEINKWKMKIKKEADSLSASIKKK